MPILQNIVDKVKNNTRISLKEALFLYNSLSLSELILLASQIKTARFGKKVFFVQNIHIEPSNYCIYKCKFCSFHRQPNEKDFWDYSFEEIELSLKKLPQTIKEIHITGGVHPDKDLNWYKELIKRIKRIHPQAGIKAFTAIEINFMCKKQRISIEEGLTILKESGLQSLAGGGAEILNDDIRKKLCPEKGRSELWINIHKLAHSVGIPSNATMLYGHIETIEQRLEHMEIIRQIQDETRLFQAFIPLKFKNQYNFLSNIKETNFVEDIKTFAISRIFLDNIPHIKAYWPMLGRDKAIFLLHCGVDDFDGTIYDSTKIYTMAGSEEYHPTMTVNEIKQYILKENFIPVERDIFYNEIN